MPPLLGWSRPTPHRRHRTSQRRNAKPGRVGAGRSLRLELLERRALLATLGNLVWQDADNDGVQHATESGVLGAVVELRDSSGVSRGVRITGAGGDYAFGGLAAGDYRLEVRTPVGYAFTTQNAGGNIALDSDVDPATGRTDLFSLGVTDDLNRDAGLTGAAPDFGFALRAGSAGADRGEAIAVDSEGNVYVTGAFTGQVDFDSGPGEWNLTSLGGDDIFIAKYTSTGALVWARALGGAGTSNTGLGIAVTPAGEVVATGRFSATVDFDPSAEGTAELTSADGDDIFVVKLDGLGNFGWARRIGGDGQEVGQGVAVDASGSVYVTGRFDGDVDFDPGVSEMFLSAGPVNNAFFVKLDAAGQFVWARSAQGGNSFNEGLAIAVNSNGQVFASGLFGGSTILGTTLLGSQGGADIFVTQLDQDGQFVWSKGFGGTESEQLGGMAVDPQGNVILAGAFEKTVDFDPSGGVHNLSAVAAKDAFISKLDTTGSFVWARTYGGSEVEQATGIAADNNGNLYVTGRFHGSVDFDSGFGTDVLASAGGSDIFVAKLDALGTHVKALAVGGEGADESSAIAVDGLGRPYITGYFITAPNAPADFDPGPAVFGLESAGSDDLFVARLSVEGLSNSAPILVPIGIIILIDEDTPTTISLDDWVNAGPGTTTIVDVDTTDPLGGIAVILTVGQGMFAYSLDGVTFFDVGSVSNTQALLLPPDVDLRYTPTMLDGEIAELTYRAWDGTVGAVGQKVDASDFGGEEAFSIQTETITFDVASLNDAPVLVPANSTAATDEDTVLEFRVADLSNGSIADSAISDADPDDVVGGVAVTQVMGFGLLSYSLDGGAFTVLNSVSEANALLLPPSAMLRYTPQGDIGELAVISYRAWDGTTGLPGQRGNAGFHGGTTAFSDQFDSLFIDVADVNDAPLLHPEAPVRTTTEDNPLVLPLPSFINAGPGTTGIVDLDTSGETPGIAVIGTTGNGTWEYAVNGFDFQFVTPVSENMALLLPIHANLRYTPDSANGEVASLTFRAWDWTTGAAEDRVNASSHGGTTAFSSDTDTLWINVSGLNDPPSGIGLSNLNVAENAVAAVVGTVTVSDPDLNDTHTLTVSDERFEVTGGQLRLKAGQSLDHEAADQVTLSITAVDSGGLSLNQSFTLNVLDVNEPPTGMELDNDSVAENDAGAVVGQLSVSDPDDGDIHSFEFSDPRFEVVGGQLKLMNGVSLDHEAEPTIDLTITVKDSGDLTHTQEFTIQVEDRNEAPTSVMLSANTVVENQAGTVIGTLTATDPDANQQHVFSVNDPRFEVVSGQLKLRLAESLDFEAEPQVNLNVTATDNGTPAKELTVSVTINVQNVNEPPTAVHLQPDSIDENLDGAVIGTLIVDDPESQDDHTFLVGDERFEVVNGQLKLKDGIRLDHETESSVEVVLTVSDDGQPQQQATLTVTVQVGDVNEPPQLVAQLPNQHGMSNRPLSVVIPAEAFFDVDEDDDLRYTALSFDGSPLPDWLGFDASSRTFSGTPSIYDPGQYAVTVTVHDQGNLTADGTFMFDIQPAPAPWQHPFNPLDVNGDGIVSPVDILIIINYINTHPSDPTLPTTPKAPPPFYDVNGDNLVTAADVLFVINFLNATGTAEGEAGADADPEWLVVNPPRDLLIGSFASQHESGSPDRAASLGIGTLLESVPSRRTSLRSTPLLEAWTDAVLAHRFVTPSTPQGDWAWDEPLFRGELDEAAEELAELMARGNT